jgi:hypothetical protein
MDEMTKMKIEQRAYELFVKRGGIHGYHFEDWQQAESEINTFSSSTGKVHIETPDHSKADHTNKSSAKTTVKKTINTSKPKKNNAFV